MNWPVIVRYGGGYAVGAAGATVGVATGLAVLSGVGVAAVAFGALAVAGVVIVVTLGTTGASTTTVGNEGGKSAVTGPDDGVGADPGGGVKYFFYAVGLAGWGAAVLAVAVL